MAPRSKQGEQIVSNQSTPSSDLILRNKDTAPDLRDVSFFKSTRFDALNIWTTPKVQDLASQSLARVRESGVSESVKALLSESVQKYLKAFSGWLIRPPKDLPNFLNYCGVNTHAADTSLSGTIPLHPHIYAILNMKILDALVDATRGVDDLAADPPSCSPEQSPLVQNNKAPKSGLSSTRHFSGTLQDFIGRLGKLGHKPDWNMTPTSETLQDTGDDAGGNNQQGDDIMKSLFLESKFTFQASTKLKLHSHILLLALLVRAWCTVSFFLDVTAI